MGPYPLYLIAEICLALLPPKLCWWLAERLSDLQCRLNATDRRIVAENLSVVMGRPVSEHAPEVRDAFRNFGRYLVEFLTAHQLTRFPITAESREEAARVFPSGRGTIILSAHVGNWEAGGMILQQWGHQTTALAMEHRDKRVNALFNRQRTRWGIEVAVLGPGAARQCISALKRGHVLGLISDREFGNNGIEVMFFGHRVIMPRGPALLSLRTGAPAVPFFVIREGRGKLRFEMEPAIWPSEAASAADPVLHLTQRYAQTIERSVRKHPTQWLMFQHAFRQNPAVKEVSQHDALLCRNPRV